MKSRHLLNAMLFVGIMIVSALPVTALARTAVGDGNILLTIDQESASLTAGDWIAFNSKISNTGETASPQLVAHLSVASIQPGHHVDPEDWSPMMTQYLEPIPPGGSVQLSWDVHTLFEGDFAVFVTIVSPEDTFVPVVSPALQIHAEPDNILPLAEVLPMVVLIPFFPLGLLLFNLIRSRRM